MVILDIRTHASRYMNIHIREFLTELSFWKEKEAIVLNNCGFLNFSIIR